MGELVQFQVKTPNCFESEPWNWGSVTMFNRYRSDNGKWKR